MNKEQKKNVIIDFLDNMRKKGVHLCEVDKFNKEMSIWESKNWIKILNDFN